MSGEMSVKDTGGAATNNYRVVSVTPTMVGYRGKKKKKRIVG